jgi:hypothetical protein
MTYNYVGVLTVTEILSNNWCVKELFTDGFRSLCASKNTNEIQ